MLTAASRSSSLNLSSQMIVQLDPTTPSPAYQRIQDHLQSTFQPVLSSTMGRVLATQPSIIPYQAGSRVRVVLGDSLGGGNAGSTDTFTIGPSNDTSCLQPGWEFPDDEIFNPFPPGGTIQPQSS